MARSAAGKSLSLLMAAVVLSAATAPPAMRHSHEGGDVPHTHVADALVQGQRHRHPHEQRHAHQPAHPHDPQHTASAVVQSSSGIAPAVHYHVWWLGMEWHLPALPHDESRDGSLPLLDTCLVQLTGECVVGPPHEAAGRVFWEAPRSVPGRVYVDDARWFPSGWPHLRSAAPLCDVARHERSGVQLA